MKVCIFCGSESDKLTKEHVWPQWLRKYPAYENVRSQLGPRPGWSDYEVVTDADGRFVSVAKPRPGLIPILPEVTVKIVCARCNNGWMSKLETDAGGLIQRLMADERIDLSPAEQELLALWVAKTMLVYSKCREPINQPFADADFRALYRTRKPPDRAMLWIGRSDAPHAQVAMSLEPILWAPKEATPAEVAVMQPTTANVYLAAHGVVFIGHFFPAFEEFDEVARRMLSFAPNARIGLQRLWPMRGRVRWPLAPISPDALDAQREYLGRMSNDLALPMVGLTPEEVAQAAEMFSAGTEPKAIWDHFGLVEPEA